MWNIKCVKRRNCLLTSSTREYIMYMAPKKKQKKKTITKTPTWYHINRLYMTRKLILRLSCIFILLKMYFFNTVLVESWIKSEPVLPSTGETGEQACKSIYHQQGVLVHCNWNDTTVVNITLTFLRTYFFVLILHYESVRMNYMTKKSYNNIERYFYGTPYTS